MKKDNPYHDESMWKGASANTFSKAERLRNNMTTPESILWEAVKGNKVEGYKFRRQHPIHLYIADFYCHKLKLVIEIDGEYHNSETQLKKDQERTSYLNAQGIQIIRFTNSEVINNLNEVINKIKEVINKIKEQINQTPLP